MIANQPDALPVGSSPIAPTARLCILETTDLHVHLLDYDYFADRVDENCGLVRLLEPIHALRSAPGQTTLLFDNGDFIQGNPLADHLATQSPQDGVHPMIHAFNALQYDAVALGNHEFNYGLPFLRRALRDARFPVVCANIDDRHVRPIAKSFCMIERSLTCSDGQSRPITIGVIGFVTPQITQWDHDALAGHLVTEDIVICARRLVPHIKSAGADVIIALCHAGIAAETHTDRMENPAVPLASIDGIDVLLTGHTHDVFPDPTLASTRVVNPVAGTLHGKPTVMAGFYGNRLGVVDLDLRVDAKGWQIAHHQISLEVGSAPTPVTAHLHDTIKAGLTNGHQATLAHIRQPVATTMNPVHSYFATIVPDLGQQLLAKAQRDHVRSALSDTPQADLPVISATSPFMFGDKSGPGHYIDIAPGPLTLRDTAAIYPFANTLCAVLQTGADLRAWLERAAAHFQHLIPGRADQALLMHHSPGYDFDALYGLRYEIDLSQPARHATDGLVVMPQAARIRNMTYQGRPVLDDDLFVLATNSYRAYGGGNYPAIDDRNILYRSAQSTRDILIASLRQQQTIVDQIEPTWRFSDLPDTSATFLSAPKARHHMTKAMRHLGPGPDGFDTYQLIL